MRGDVIGHAKVVVHARSASTVSSPLRRLQEREQRLEVLVAVAVEHRCLSDARRENDIAGRAGRR